MKNENDCHAGGPTRRPEAYQGGWVNRTHLHPEILRFAPARQIAGTSRCSCHFLLLFESLDCEGWSWHRPFRRKPESRQAGLAFWTPASAGVVFLQVRCKWVRRGVVS